MTPDITPSMTPVTIPGWQGSQLYELPSGEVGYTDPQGNWTTVVLKNGVDIAGTASFTPPKQQTIAVNLPKQMASASPSTPINTVQLNNLANTVTTELKNVTRGKTLLIVIAVLAAAIIINDFHK